MGCRRLAVLMFCVRGAAGFARQFPARDVVLMAAVISGAYLLVGVGVELALGTFRPWSAGYRFAGTVHPNTQGTHLTVLCLASFCLARSATREKAWLWTLFAVALAFLLLSRSRTACAALAIALAVLWLTSVSGRTRVIVALVAGFVVATAALASTLLGVDLDEKLANVVMLGRQEDSESLTGRVPVWIELSNYIRARPLQGYGYEAFWTTKHIEAVSDEVQWPLREAHSAYIDGLLSVGAIGVSTFLAAVVLSLRRAAVAFRRTGDPGFAFTLCLLVCGLANACLETGMMSPNFITLMAACGVAQLLVVP
jgi:exopolysaccharide production protein ExoQ